MFAPLKGEVTLTQPIEISDISPSGMRIVSSFALNLNCPYEFRLTVGDLSVVARGRVVHTRASGPDEGVRVYLAGIEFIDVSESSQVIINDFIKLMRLAEFEIGAQEKASDQETLVKTPQPKLPLAR